MHGRGAYAVHKQERQCRLSEEITNPEQVTAPVETPEEAPKPRRTRTRKVAAEKAAEQPVAEAPAPAEAAEEPAPAPKRRPGRPRMTDEEKAAAAAKRAAAKAAKAAKAEAEKAAEPEAAPATKAEVEPEASLAPAEAPKRRRTRTRKADADAAAEAPAAPAAEAVPAEPSPVESAPVEVAPESKGGEPEAERPATRTRRRRASADDVPAADEMTRMTQEMTRASAEPTELPARTLQEADSAAEATPAQDAAPTGGSRKRRRKSRDNQQGTGQQQNQQQNQQGQHANQGNRRRNRRGNEPAEPTLTREELAEMKVTELRSKAAELEIDGTGMKKAELVEAIYAAAARAEGFRHVRGVLEIQNEGYGFVRTNNYMQGPDDAFVFQQMIRAFGLRPGDVLEGTVGPNRGSNKYPPLQQLDSVNGRPPEDAKRRPNFRDLTPIFPNERLKLEHGKDSITGRAIDLVAPIGKGQRGLIVSPPKAGKTTILKRICESIAANNPEVHLICLLVDERPEEVTDMQRSIKGEVVASTFDMPADNHTSVSELVIEHAKRLVEQGDDVVVVLDSITRLARAYNLAAPASGRILSGGVDSAALYPPKRFLGAARNIEHGGSLTIIASALIDTGSKMDEVIFEEFKGTGNMELKLDRDLADKRIFPAIDPVASGTRNEDLLIDADMQPFVWGLRRILANMNNVERAEASLVKSLKATQTNQEFLIRSAKKAQLAEYSDAL